VGVSVHVSVDLGLGFIPSLREEDDEPPAMAMSTTARGSCQGRRGNDRPGSVQQGRVVVVNSGGASHCSCALDLDRD